MPFKCSKQIHRYLLDYLNCKPVDGSLFPFFNEHEICRVIHNPSKLALYSSTFTTKDIHPSFTRWFCRYLFEYKHLCYETYVTYKKTIWRLNKLTYTTEFGIRATFSFFHINVSLLLLLAQTSDSPELSATAWDNLKLWIQLQFIFFLLLSFALTLNLLNENLHKCFLVCSFLLRRNTNCISCDVTELTK